MNVAGGVRIEEPGADLAVALAIASAARGVPVREGLAAFGEIGLTGRLRQASQAERRLEECAKLGIATVIAPAGTAEPDVSARRRGGDAARRDRGGTRNGVGAGRRRRRVACSHLVAVPLIGCEERAMMWPGRRQEDAAGAFS